jgi:hypothetical protein
MPKNQTLPRGASEKRHGGPSKQFPNGCGAMLAKAGQQEVSAGLDNAPQVTGKRRQRCGIQIGGDAGGKATAEGSGRAAKHGQVASFLKRFPIDVACHHLRGAKQARGTGKNTGTGADVGEYVSGAENLFERLERQLGRRMVA